MEEGSKASSCGSERIVKNKELRDWLSTHSISDGDSVSSIHERRHKNSHLILDLKRGLKTDPNHQSEIRTNLLFSGVNETSARKIASCGSSLSECQKTIHQISHRHHKELDQLRDRIYNYDVDQRCEVAGMNPATLLTEYKRKIMFHALLNSGGVDMDREEASQILDAHISELENASLVSSLCPSVNSNFPSIDVQKIQVDRTYALGIPTSRIAKGHRDNNSIRRSTPSLQPLTTTADRANRKDSQSTGSGSLSRSTGSSRYYSEKSKNKKFQPEWNNYEAMRNRWPHVKPTMGKLK